MGTPGAFPSHDVTLPKAVDPGKRGKAMPMACIVALRAQVGLYQYLNRVRTQALIAP
jgi:hypothetical protein